MASLSASMAPIASDSQVNILIFCHMPYPTEVGKGTDFVIQLGKARPERAKRAFNVAELCQHRAADASSGDPPTTAIDGTIHCAYPLVGKGSHFFPPILPP